MGIMKKIFILTAFLILNKTFAYDAIVIVLEAPLLKEAKLNSTVLQTLRKGARVYVPDEIGKLLAQNHDLPEFIQTYDRVGNVAFVPKKYIKIITEDLNEEKMPITIAGHDPTDYRIEEPISKTYPFDDSVTLRANVSLMLGNNTKNTYEYNSLFSKQNFSNETGLRLAVTRKVSFDKYDRIYFGLVTAFSIFENNISFQNSNTAVENCSILKLGPIITFDAYKADNLRFTLGTGFTYNYHQSSLTLSDTLENSETRDFSGYSLAPFINTAVQFTNVFPMTDFLIGSDFNLYLPHGQKTNTQPDSSGPWGANSVPKINAGIETQLSFFLGLQVKY
jgi:hypothetical protein